MDRERESQRDGAERQREKQKQRRGRETGLLPGAWAVPGASQEGSLQERLVGSVGLLTWEGAPFDAQ